MRHRLLVWTLFSSCANCDRLCFAWEDEELLAEGIERLARVIRALQEEQQAGDAQPARRSPHHAAETKAKDFW
jgi:hypothetical protein